jgi:hypothetical protein
MGPLQTPVFVPFQTVAKVLGEAVDHGYCGVLSGQRSHAAPKVRSRAVNLCRVRPLLGYLDSPLELLADEMPVLALIANRWDAMDCDSGLS